MSEKFCFGNLEDKYLQVINKIYKDNDYKCIKGGQAKELWKRLKDK